MILSARRCNRLAAAVASLPKQQSRGARPKYQDGIAGRPPKFNAKSTASNSNKPAGDWRKEQINDQLEEKRRAELDDLFAPEGDYSVAGEEVGADESKPENEQKQWKGGWVQVHTSHTDLFS